MDVYQKLEKFIDQKIATLNRQLRITRVVYISFRVLVFLLNLISFALTFVVLVVFWQDFSQSGTKFSNELQNWTLVFAFFLVLSVIINGVLVFFAPLRKTKEYRKLLLEIKYLWFKYSLNPNYGRQKLESEIKAAQELYLKKKRISKSKWIKRVILGEKIN